MNQDIAKFYQVVRNDEALIAALSAGKSIDEIMETAVDQARKHGLSFTKEEAMEVAGDIDRFRANLVDDAELNDFELEMISAGLPINCSNGSNTIK